MKAKAKKYDNGGKVTGANTKKEISGFSPLNRRKQKQLDRAVRESQRAKRVNESEARRAASRPDYKPKKKLDERLLDDAYPQGPHSGPVLLVPDTFRRNVVTKLEMTSPKKTLNKSKAVIPVPTKKELRKLK